MHTSNQPKESCESHDGKEHRIFSSYREEETEDSGHTQGDDDKIKDIPRICTIFPKRAPVPDFDQYFSNEVKKKSKIQPQK